MADTALDRLNQTQIELLQKYNDAANKLSEVKEHLASGEVKVAEAENALQLGGKKLLATVNDDGSFNDDGIFKIKEVNGQKTLSGILDINMYVKSMPVPFDIFGDGSRIALYEFEGNVNDTGGVYNATPQNIVYCDGKFGRAIDYGSKGKDSHIKTPVIKRNGSKEITVAGWINVYGHTGEYLNIWHLTPDGDGDTGNSRQPALWLYNDDNTKFHIKNDGVSSNSLGIGSSQGSIQYGQWHHIVQVVTLRQIKFYIDGVLTDTYNSDEDFRFNDGVFYIGDPWHNKNHIIDQVSIFNRALTDAEVRTLYNEGA